MKVSSLVFIAILAGPLEANLQTLVCDGLSNTCNPTQCQKVSNAACTAPTSKINVPLALSKISCKACTQSSDPRCSSSSLKAMLTMNAGIKAAYCTDKYLVIHSDNTPNHDDSLADIQRPPGGGSGGDYASQCVTRGRVKQFMSFKIPLNPKALDTASTSNNMNAFTSNGMDSLTNIPLPKSGPSAYTKSGMPIFPPFNDQSVYTWRSCEQDRCNAHVGKGFDYHYHGDPFGYPDRPCLYGASDYESESAHPPLIGWGADGFSLYGRYLNESAPGYEVPLDDCGGHSHGSYGYHYHSQVLTITEQGWTFPAFIGGPHKCWKGDISGIDKFWDTKGKTVAYGSGISTELGNLNERDDYEFLKPCCNMTNMYVAEGVTLQTTLKSDSPAMNLSKISILFFFTFSLFF